ncbi:MAG: Type 1 glutamine amidotransferase-like domain-containing protein [Desulfotignum sp.]|nr:Type 1 glutamine amidotransferase-like domain-containing protein [Desulfotignum sp.]
MNYPKIGIYAGAGTSHSWLWFVDLFEKAGFYDLHFLDEFSVQNNDINTLDALIVSGGDTFAVAQSLGKKGGDNIRAFVEKGGIYIGSCAGAYLPMNSSKHPLDLFNFVDVKITNLSKSFPEATVKTCKFCTAYGCDYVFHPVREAVSLKTTSFFDKGKTFEFRAPLYGGPGMKARDPSWVLAVYEGFTPKTSFLTTLKIARQTLISQGAVLKIPFKSGVFYLLGPHLEHPKFNQANQFIIDAIYRETCKNQNHVDLEKKPCKQQLPAKKAKELLLTI